ncbi:matrixin family metalloprotease [Myxococcota bacterium]|nr:matrixin family metalloprotease [Myxococcota bacterium]
MIIEASTLATLALATATGWLPSGHRWATAEIPVPYCITANARNTSLTAAQQRTQLTNAIDQWRATGNGGSLSCTIYNATSQGGTCRTATDGGDGQNNIFWNRNWQHGSQTIGVTWSTFFNNCGSVTDDTGARHNLQCSQDADIEFNDVHYTWNADGSDTDIASIAVHEYGHFIGLDHCNDNNTCQLGSGIMYAAYAGAIRVLQPDDLQGGCGLYPGTNGGLGWPCSNNAGCSAAPICVNPQNSGYCTQTCTGTGQGTCAAGYACQPNPQNAAQTVCLRDDGLNRGLCEVCQGSLPNACANGGECFTGIPERNTGRCVTPCPNPGATDGGCPTNYTCLQVGLGNGQTGDFCFPRSSDCTDLTNFTELDLGQNCTGNPPCAAGLDCIGICSQTCTGGPGQGNCPSGYACETFNFESGPESYCAPPVNEGQNCNGIKACTTGPCLVSGSSNIATCYRDCAGNPGACNNAQTCNTYQLSAGGSVSICEPPGVPPRPDAGVPPDTGVPACACDTSNNCEAGCGCDPNCSTPFDAGVTGQDASVGPVDAGNGGGGSCSCDETYACDPGCEQCDPECPCTCDDTFACTEGCSCDPECYASSGRKSSGCTATDPVLPEETGSNPWLAAALVVLGLGLLGKRRFVR